MTGFDPALCAYVAAGELVRLAQPEPEAPPPATGNATLVMSSVTQGKVTTTSLAVSGGDGAAVDLAATRWRVTPNPAGYAKQSLTGSKAVFRHTASSAGSSTVTAYVPRVGGGADVEVTATITYSSAYISGLFPRTATYGGEPIKVEDSFGFAAGRTATCRLVRTCSPGIPAETTVVDTRTITFPPTVGVALSTAITYPTQPGLGAGYQYYWEVNLGAGHTVRSGPLPVWVLGQDARCAPQKLSAAPATVDYPAVYTRKASDARRVTPAAGKTYQDHINRFLYDWKAQNLSAPIGGAWISYNDYFANLYYIDLDDTTIPRYTFKHWDVWEWGFDVGGWYGDDPYAKPFPRSKVAVDIPVPHNAMPSVGTDRSLVIVGMRAGKVVKVWEFWLAQRMGDGGWRAASIGVTTAADEWRHSASYTSAAAGISALAYALRCAEGKSAVEYVRAERAAGRVPSEAEIVRRVPHALSINQPNPAAGQVSYPATYTDGNDPNPATAWEGQLVYFRADADVAAQKFSPLHHVIAVVGKHRGLRVTDKTYWSTTLIVEGDQSYGGNVWSTLRDPGESWAFKVPDDWWVIGKQYPNKAAFDADTTP